MNHLRVAIIIIILYIGSFSTASGFDYLHGAQAVAKLNYDSLYQAAAPIERSAEGRQLMAHCLARYGGVEALKKLVGYRLTLRMKAFLNRDSLDITKSFHRGRQYRINRVGPINNETRILNGDRSWYQASDTLINLNDGRYRAELFSYLTLALPLAMKTERFDGIRVGLRDNDSLVYIYMRKKDSLTIVVGIDPHSYLIKSSEGIIEQGKDNFVFINHFSDHREYGGYVFPFQLTNISMGLEVARSIVTKVEINPEFAAGEFRPRRIINPRTAY